MPRLADAVRVRHAVLMIAMALVIWPAAVSQTAPQPTRQLLPTDLETLSWRSIGPANMGGRVASISIAPSDPKTFYIGYATGGVWKTTNNGTTYSPVFDKYETSSIGAVAVCDAPENWPGWAEEEKEQSEGGDATDNASGGEEKSKAERGKGKIVWVGTGEGNNRNSSSWGHGVYRSTDGGGEFTCVGLEDSHNIPALAVDPKNPDVCYVAALGRLWGFNDTRGVYKTTDGGKNWQRVLFIDNETGACDVVMDPRSPNTLYAAMYRRIRTTWSYQGVSDKGGIYKSTDAGATWTKLTDGLPAQTGRIGLDIYHDDPSIVIAVVESDSEGWIGDEFSNRQRTGGVFRSNNGGTNWTRTSSLNPRSFYFSRIKIDPHDSNRVYLLGWELYVSDDGGQNFRAGSARVPHVDFHAMVIDPRDTDRLFIGTDGGLYISEDRGKTWNFQNTMAVGQFYNIELDDSDPYRVGGGLQDNGTWIGPSETITEEAPDTFMGRGGGITNAEWQFVYGGDGFYVAFDAEDKNIIYAEAQGGWIGRVHLDTGAIYTLKPAEREGQAKYRFNWNAPFFTSRHDSKTLYLGGNVVFKLTDRGNTWTQISDDLSTGDLAKMITAGSLAEQYGTIVSLAESPVEQGVLWAGTDDGKVHMTRDDGGTWKDVTPAQVNGMYVSRIEASSHDVGTAYVTVDGHRSDNFSAIVLMTEDGGATWTDIKGDLPDGTPIDVIREDPRNPNVLYIGTETSAFVTIDRGVRWVKLNGKSLPTVAVEDLKIHPREMDLVAGTHGRSIYILDDVSAISQLNNDIVQKPLHVFTPMPGKPRYKLPYGGLWSDDMFIASNPPAGAMIHYWLRDYSPEPVKIVIKKGEHTVVELTGSNRPGLNRVTWDLLPDAKQRLDNPHFLPEFVPAGTYDVAVSQDKLNGKTQVEVLEAPGPVMP